MTFRRVKKFIERNRVRVITFVLTLTLLCFSTFSVSAYTWDELETSWWNTYSIDHYNVICWENEYWTDYSTEIDINDNGVAFNFYVEDSGLTGPEREVCYMTTSTSFYKGQGVLSFISIPINVTTPEQSIALQYEITNAYSVINYYLLDDAGGRANKELKIQHTNFQNDPLSDGLKPPVNDFESPDYPGLDGGFLWSPNDRITVDFGRPVVFEMVTTYVEFNVYPYRSSQAQPSGAPAVQVSYQGKGYDYIPGTMEDVRFFGLNEPDISVGDAIKNSDISADEIGSILASVEISGVVGLFNSLMNVPLFKALVVVGVSGSVIAAIIGVASAYSHKKE